MRSKPINSWYLRENPRESFKKQVKEKGNKWEWRTTDDEVYEAKRIAIEHRAVKKLIDEQFGGLSVQEIRAILKKERPELFV